MPYVASWTNQKLLPTRDQILAALRSANNPDPLKQDARPLQAIIAQLPQADIDILSAMQRRTSIITGYEWSVEAAIPPGAVVAPTVELARAAEIAQRYRTSGLHNEHGTMLNGIYAGALALELQWSTAEGGAHVVEQYEVVDPIDLKRDKRALRGYSRYLYTGTGNTAFTLMPYDYRENVILCTWNPLRGIRSEFDGGLLRVLIYLTVLKHFNWYDWARVGERYGDPAVVGTYPRAMGGRKDKDGKTEAEKVLEWVNEIATESGAVLPDDIKIQIHDLVTKGISAELFEKFIDKVTSKQERLLLGQDVVDIAGAPGGSYAKAKESGKTTSNLSWSDLLWLQNIISDQYVISDYVLNYGLPSTGIFPAFRFNTDELVDFRTNAAIVQLLTSSGYRLDTDEVRIKTGFSVTESTNTNDGFGDML